MGWRYLRMRDDESGHFERLKRKARALKEQMEEICEEMEELEGEYGERGGGYGERSMGRRDNDSRGIGYRDGGYGERGNWVPHGEIVDDYVDERRVGMRGGDSSFGERRGVRGSGGR